MWKRLKNLLAKWTWKDNDWTETINDLKMAARNLRWGVADKYVLHWQAKYMKEPNKFTITIKRTEE